jgi:hypothetical protein
LEPAPRRVKSAVRLLVVSTTLEALYPEQTSWAFGAVGSWTLGVTLGA